MFEMTLRHIEPLEPLKGYVEKIWVYESNGRVPSEDMKLIVPNGLIKLVIPFRNGLSGKMEGCYHLSKEHSITLIGICDQPSIVDAEKDVASGTIGIEFSTAGAYRFFDVRQSEIKNKIYPLEDIMGGIGRQLQEEICNEAQIDGKVAIIQNFLLRAFIQKPQDNIFEYCISRIKNTNGGITISQLEKETGYTSRWLNKKFDEKVGISPKNLSTIIRFQQYYAAFATDRLEIITEKDFYTHYYDQSHFIKEFRRFTGLPPVKLEKTLNEFGKLFYRK